MSSAVVSADGLSIVVTYSENVAGTPEAADYAVTLNSGPASFSAAAISGTHVTLTLSAPMASSDTVSDLVYTASQGTADSIVDTATSPNTAATQTLALVTNSSAAIVGTAGDDANLGGTAGPDYIYGLGGADTITGGAGADVLTGGDGIDTFVIAFGGEGGDTITDFAVASEVIDFSGASDVNLHSFGSPADFLSNSLDNPLDTTWVVNDNQVLHNGLTAITGITAATASAGAIETALANVGNGFILNHNLDVEYIVLNVTDVDAVTAGNQAGAVIARIVGDGGNVVIASDTTVVATLVGVDVASLTAANFIDFIGA